MHECPKAVSSIVTTRESQILLWSTAAHTVKAHTGLKGTDRFPCHTHTDHTLISQTRWSLQRSVSFNRNTHCYHIYHNNAPDLDLHVSKRQWHPAKLEANPRPLPTIRPVLCPRRCRDDRRCCHGQFFQENSGRSKPAHLRTSPRGCTRKRGGQPPWTFQSFRLASRCRCFVAAGRKK